MVKRLWKHGIGTIPKHEVQRSIGRGKLSFDVTRCTSCGDCVSECPTEALSLQGGESGMLFSLAHGSCISCRVCTQICESGALPITNDPIPSVRERDQLTVHYTIPSEQIKQKGDVRSEKHRTAIAIRD
ncbi:4Fe-4S dicluster domain-containing protein [Alicyclobacillus fastidiosus]|uniref:4Fe-4S dicluster domain-containing protein n=1 Tax=Alicyclobacillus fastidiosus TaxID=392011 RepID=UPI0034D6B07C